MRTQKRLYLEAITCIAGVLFTAQFINASGLESTSGPNGSPGIGHQYVQQQGGQGDQKRGRGERRQPPPEAIEACNGKEVGDKVEFETPHGDVIRGTCVQKDDLIFAVPERGHRPPSSRKGMDNRKNR